MGKLFKVSSSPHVREKGLTDTTQKIMIAVIIALLPTTCYGVYHFGIRALYHIIISVATCVISEWAFQKGMKQKVLIGDFSAILTGLLLALNLPVAAPLWISIIGGVFAIIVVKQLFGGLGQNFMNPALAARCFLVISFTSHMTNFMYDATAQATSTATPLAMIKSGQMVDTWDLFIGNIAGTIGETSAVAILLGACLLIGLGVIDLRIPGTYIVSFVIFITIFSGRGFDTTYIAAQVMGGGLLLGAFFMATDYVTSPITKSGQIVFGIILGILTGVFRLFGASAEGVSYAIIISNLLVPLIEKVTIPRAFGRGGE